MDVKQEKLDDMKQDMLMEQKMREDFEYCIEQYQSLDTLIIAFKGLHKHLELYGYEVTYSEMCDDILEHM